LRRAPREPDLHDRQEVMVEACSEPSLAEEFSSRTADDPPTSRLPCRLLPRSVSRSESFGPGQPPRSPAGSPSTCSSI
jgi:hypothetical protein